MKAPVIKLSSPATREFWEIPVLHEDAQLLALDKPARLLVSPDRYDADRPNLMRLLHDGIAAGKPWAKERNLTYLSNAHRLDFETTGVLLLAKDKTSLVFLANLFGSEQPVKTYLALVHGHPTEKEFVIEERLAPHPSKLGLMRVDHKRGKKSITRVEVLEQYRDHSLLRCQPITDRTHQLRVHLAFAGHPIVGDRLYEGDPLWLSRLKRGFYLKNNREERPLIGTAALHAEKLSVPHPVTGEPVIIEAARPKDLNVALKYLQRYASAGGEQPES